MHGEREWAQGFVEKSERINRLEDLDVDEEIILKRILKTWDKRA